MSLAFIGKKTIVSLSDGSGHPGIVYKTGVGFLGTVIGAHERVVILHCLNENWT